MGKSKHRPQKGGNGANEAPKDANKGKDSKNAETPLNTKNQAKGTTKASKFSLRSPPAYQHQVGLLVFVSVLAVYVQTTNPAVGGGDSGELMAVAHELGTAHPPGYPLFTIYSKASEVFFSSVSGGSIPLGKAMNLGHSLLSAFAVLFLYYATTRVTGLISSGIFSAGMFAFSPAVWTYAVHTEVFPMNNFFVTLLILLCTLFYAAKISGSPSVHRYLYFSSFVSGLASTNQHTIAVYLLPIILWVFLLDRDQLTVARFFKCTLLYILGLTPYLYLPWSAYFIKSKQSWGDCLSFSGLKTHLLREEYGTFSLASKEARYDVNNFWVANAKYFEDLKDQSLQVLWLLGCLGLIRTFYATSKQRSINGIMNVEMIFFIMYAFYLVFFHLLANLPLDRSLYVGVTQRFWIQPLSLAILFMGCGFGVIQRTIAGRMSSSHGRATVSLIFCTIAVALTSIQCQKHYAACDESGNTIIRDFGRTVLYGLEKNALLLTKGDIIINSARYVQTFEGFRTDVTMADQEMMTYPWAVSHLKHNFPDLLFPPGKDHYFPGKPLGFSMRQLLDLNYPKRPIYLCHGWKSGDPSIQGFYKSRPWGVATEVKKETSKPLGLKGLRNYIEKTSDTILRAENVTLVPEDHSYPDYAWELVVRNDYWDAWSRLAYFLMQEAERGMQQSSPTPSKDNRNWIAIERTVEIYRYLYRNMKPTPTAILRNFGVSLQHYIRFRGDDVEAFDDAHATFAKYLNMSLELKQEIPGGVETMEYAVTYYKNMAAAKRAQQRR